MAEAHNPPIQQLVNKLVAELIPYSNNSRTHTPEQISSIAASVKEFGWTNPLLIDSKNGVIAGHGRLAAAQKLGMISVPCIVLGHLTDQQRRAYVIADNQLSITGAGWNLEILSAEVGRLMAEGFNVTMTGFDQAEIDEMMAVKAEVKFVAAPAQKTVCPHCGKEVEELRKVA